MIVWTRLDPDTQVALIRAALFFGPVWIVYIFVVLRPLKKAELTGILLAFLWCFFSLILVNALVIHLGGWHFLVRGGTLWSIPLDLVLGWAMLWSVLPSIRIFRRNLMTWFGILLAIDLVVMPLLDRVVRLSDNWIWGELACLLLVYVPSRILADDTRTDEHLHRRNVLQMLLYGMIFFGILPVWVMKSIGAGLSWIDDPATLTGFFMLYLVIALIGVSALQELDIRGAGTPFPLDPTRRLVTTGPYAYVANPMQLCQGLLFICLSVFVSRVFQIGLGVTIIFYLGFTRIIEKEIHQGKFGENWDVYRANVRDWWPRLFPWRNYRAALYVDLTGCGSCERVGVFLKKMNPRGLDILDAKTWPGESITRMTYLDHDGFEENGIRALGRALEHYNVLLALPGFFIRLPGISHILQGAADIFFPPHNATGTCNSGLKRKYPVVGK